MAAIHDAAAICAGRQHNACSVFVHLLWGFGSSYSNQIELHAVFIQMRGRGPHSSTAGDQSPQRLGGQARGQERGSA